MFNNFTDHELKVIWIVIFSTYFECNVLYGSRGGSVQAEMRSNIAGLSLILWMLTLPFSYFNVLTVLWKTRVLQIHVFCESMGGKKKKSAAPVVPAAAATGQNRNGAATAASSVAEEPKKQPGNNKPAVKENKSKGRFPEELRWAWFSLCSFWLSYKYQRFPVTTSFTQTGFIQYFNYV